MKLARLAPLVLLALVACSPSPTTAAVVGDTSIPQQRVEDLMEACPVFGETPVEEGIALTIIARLELFRAVGEASDLDMSEERLDAYLRSNEEALAIIREQPDCIDILKPQAAQLILQEEANPDQAQASLAEIDVTVNPRRFQWDDQQGAMVEGSGSVSVPGSFG
ncbi:MAG: hypothetical protein ACTHWA_08665 [Arachnia sp.]